MLRFLFAADYFHWRVLYQWSFIYKSSALLHEERHYLALHEKRGLSLPLSRGFRLLSSSIRSRIHPVISRGNCMWSSSMRNLSRPVISRGVYILSSSVRFSLSHPVVSTGSHIILSSSMRFSLSHPVIRGLNYTELLYEVPSQSSRDTGSKLY